MVGKVSFDGVTGKVAFDEYGDTTTKVLTVYKVEGGKWATVKTETFESVIDVSCTRRRSARTAPRGVRRRGQALTCPAGCRRRGTPSGAPARSPARTRHQEVARGRPSLQQLVNGLTLGSLYALIAVGYTVVYGIVQLINFAHGEIFMIGAFGALVDLADASSTGNTSCGCCPS